VLALFVLLSIWIIRPFSGGGQSASSTAAGAGGSQPAAAAAGNTAAQSGTQSADDATLTDTPAPLQRKWGAGADGITYDADLASRLDQAMVGVDGDVGVAVKDLGSGRGAVLNGDMELQAASLYKLPVLYTVFDLGLNMNEELTISPEALQYDSGTMELGAGETLSVAEALERMVTLSDNTSAVLLGARVGSGNVDASIAALGMDTTHYSLERMTSSAADMLHLIDLVATGQAVSRAASADMLHLMLRQRVNDRLPRLLPDDAQVAHKTGNLPGIVNDVGVIYGQKSTVAIAAMVSSTSDETAAATGIAKLGLAAYQYFEGQPEVSDRPQIPPAPNRPIPPVYREPHPVAPPVSVVTGTGSVTGGAAARPVATRSANSELATTPTVIPGATAQSAATQFALNATPRPTVSASPTPLPTQVRATPPPPTLAPTGAPAVQVAPTAAPAVLVPVVRATVQPAPPTPAPAAPTPVPAQPTQPPVATKPVAVSNRAATPPPPPTPTAPAHH
jgi:beta-lactamase class A